MHGVPSLALDVDVNGMNSTAGVWNVDLTSSSGSAVTTPTTVYANYSSGNGTSQLLFVYAVGSGQETDRLDYTAPAERALSAPFGSIVAKETLEPVYIRSLPNPGSEGSLGWNKKIVISNRVLLVEKVSDKPWGRLPLCFGEECACDCTPSFGGKTDY